MFIVLDKHKHQCAWNLRVIGACFAGRAAISVIVVIMDLTKPIVHDARHVHTAAGCRTNPVVLSDHVKPDVVAVKRHVAVLVNTSLWPLLCQRRQLRVPFLHSFHITQQRPQLVMPRKTHLTHCTTDPWVLLSQEIKGLLTYLLTYVTRHNTEPWLHVFL